VPEPSAAPALEALRAARRAWPSAHAGILQRGRGRTTPLGSDRARDPAPALEHLLHATLAAAPLDISDDILAGCTREVAARLGTTAAVEPLLVLLRPAWTHGVLVRARAAPRHWRGVRIVQNFGDTTVEAALDLVFESESGLVLVQCTTAPSGAAATPDLELGGFMLAQSGRAVHEAGTLFLHDGSYERLEDLPARLAGVARRLSASDG
jgi:hypothetical protein